MKRMTLHFRMNNHPVSVDCDAAAGKYEPDEITLLSPDCSVSFAAAQCVFFMARHGFRQIIVDGCEINYSHVTVAA